MVAGGIDGHSAAVWSVTGEPVRVLEAAQLWGSETALIHRPGPNLVIRVPATQLTSIEARVWTSGEIQWRAAASRAVALMAQGHVASASSDELIPLPHQIAVVERALTMDPLRLLLADEVGLGKTIEAGLIVRELLDRHRISRILVVAPKGMQLQWIAEMRRFFGEEFVMVGPGGVPTGMGFNPWAAFDRVICSMDAVKPLRTRAGWDEERLVEYNRERFEGLVGAGWDLVIIDEAHHVAGATDDVARHQLAVALADEVDRVLLLSATPHSGKSDAFARLLGLVEPAFRSGAEVTRASVAPLVIRNVKRDVVDERGSKLFRPRSTTFESVPYRDRRIQRTLYEAVTDYVRHGYNQAKREGRRGHEFLVLLMQRLVSSSTAAIAAALERRALAVADEHAQLRLFSMGHEEWSDLSGEEQFGALSDARLAALGDERAEVELLRDLARRAVAEGLDSKTRFLLALLNRLAAEAGDPNTKAVVFTEFVPTQQMLVEVLEGAGIATAAISGALSLEEREREIAKFRRDARVLVSTDAGGEGINLQFAHIVINYDLPWNPMRIEQRIGRVDRIGQTRDVRAFNLAMESSIDERVLTVLQDKLQTIREELGVDKTDDVLETTSRGIGKLYVDAVIDPDHLDVAAAELATATRDEILSGPDLDDLVDAPPQRSGKSAETVPKLVAIAATARGGGSVGERTGTEAIQDRPEVLPGEPAPVVAGPVGGWWSMWELESVGSNRSDAISFFVDDHGAHRPDLAETIWQKAVDGIEPIGREGLSGAALTEIRSAIADHAYQPGIDGDGGVVLIPRLVLRVST